MKSTSAFTDANAFTPTSSSSTLIPNSCSSPSTSSSASIESSPRPSPKSGASFAMLFGSMSSFRRRTISSFTRGARLSLPIRSPQSENYRRTRAHGRLSVGVSGHPPVHPPDLPGDVGGALRHEKADDGGDLLRGGEPRHRDAPEELLAGVVLQVRDDLGRDEAGRDRVDRDLAGRELER